MNYRRVPTFFTSALIGVCLIASQASAQTGPKPEDRRGNGRHLDTNKDKMISREEAKASPMLSKSFDSIDTNKDSQLSREEMKAFHSKNKMDQDGDGNISKAEAAKRPELAKNFDRIDTDKDGIITPNERKAWMSKRKSPQSAG